jgi:hypothetical protein
MRISVHSGVLVTGAVLLLGAAAAGVAWWNNLLHTQRALDFWGPEAAVLIRDAPHVTAFRLTFPAAGEDRSEGANHPLVDPITGSPAAVRVARDISLAKGLVHLRHALLDDRSFDWTAAPREPGDHASALTFEQDGRRLLVLFSADFTRLTAVVPSDPAGDRKVSTQPIAEGLQRYFADVLPAGSE